MRPKIYGDFHNLDDDGNIRLTTAGTQRDLQRLGLELAEGLSLTCYMDDADDAGNPDDIMVDGTAHYSQSGKCWVAVVNFDAVYHASDAAVHNVGNGAEKPPIRVQS
jgi:hypothetical protein